MKGGHEPAQSVPIRICLRAKAIEIRPHNHRPYTKRVKHAVHLVMLIGIDGKCDL